MHCPNTLLKRQGYSGYIKREVPTVCYIQKTHIRHKDTNRLKVIGQTMICHTNSHHKRVGMDIFISNKANFKARNVTRDNEGRFIIMTACVHYEDIIIINVHTHSKRPKAKEKLNI